MFLVLCPSEAVANLLIDEVDDGEGYPKVASFIGSRSGVSPAACAAWIAAGQETEPPPGVCRTWARPISTSPTSWAVEVTPGLATEHLVGKTIAGFGPIQAGDVIARTPAWDNAAFGNRPTKFSQP